MFYMPRNTTLRPREEKKKKKRADGISVLSEIKKGSSTSIISAKLKGKDEEEKKQNTHTLISPPPTFKVFEEQPYFRYHSNPSSVSLSFSFLCFFSFFFFLNPSHPPLLSLLSFVADSKYNCEPLRLALCSSSFGAPQRRRASAPQSLCGGGGAGLRSVPGGS